MSIDSIIKWTGYITLTITLAMFFLTAIAVLIAVGYATVHLADNVATKDDLAQLETRLDARLARLEDLLIETQQDINLWCEFRE